MEQQVETNDWIKTEPEPIMVIDYDMMSTMKEYGKIIHALRRKYMTVKEIHELYYDKEVKKHTRGLKTIYRYIEKLTELEFVDRAANEDDKHKKGLVIEVGQRMTDGSRTVETLYGPAAKVFLYEGPQVMDQWKTPESQEKLKTMSKLTAALLDKDVDEEEFKDFAIEFLREQDEQSSRMIRVIKQNPELIELIKSVPSDYLGKMIFLTTDLAILWDRAKNK